MFLIHTNDNYQSADQLLSFNPNRQKSNKISQRLPPKHAACGVAQLPYPIYSHRKANLSKQLSWVQLGLSSSTR